MQLLMRVIDEFDVGAHELDIGVAARTTPSARASGGATNAPYPDESARPTSSIASPASTGTAAP